MSRFDYTRAIPHRDCGIYRTSTPLAGKEDWVRNDLLVYYHNHSQQGPPLVLLPDFNTNNRWTFYEKGYLVKDPHFVSALIPLLPEGFYILTEPMYLSADELIPNNTLIQLGYNRSAEPILFTSEFDANLIYFPTHGTKVTNDIFSIIAPVPFHVPSYDPGHR